MLKIGPMKYEGQFLNQLEERLGRALPGLPAQLKMSPYPMPISNASAEPPANCAQAGVVVLLYPRDDELNTVLMRRTERVLHHRAQISLPGGQVEEGESIEKAALRELKEELGVGAEGVRTLGRLTPLYIPVSDFCVHPVVAECSSRPAFVPDPVEVAEVIEVRLARLVDPASVRREKWTLHGFKVDVPFFAVEHHKVWGATAMILAEFVEVIRSLTSGHS